MKCSVSQFFFFERYLDIEQPLFHFFVLVWYGDASSVKFCSDLLSYLCFKKINEVSKVSKLVCCIYFKVGVFKGPFDVGEKVVVCAEV